MDLVKSYDSEMDDDSTDVEEIQLVPLPSKRIPKEVDVIDLDSDSTEDESTVEKEKVTENKTTSDTSNTSDFDCIILDSPVKATRNDLNSQVKETCSDLGSSSSKRIFSDINSQVKETCQSLDSLAKKTCNDLNSQMKERCIDLDSPVKKTCNNLNSEVTETCIDLASPVKKRCIDVHLDNSTENDPPIKKTRIDLNLNDSNEKDSSVRPTSKADSIPSSHSAKKIDYLNLEESESENECESNEKRINTLIETASILNETPCGPEKPTNVSNTSDSIPESVSLSKQQTDKTVVSNLITDSNSARNTPDLVRNCTSRGSAEHSLLDSSDKEPVEPFPLENNEKSDTLSCIFREDSRVIEASKKIIVSRIPRQVIQTHNAHTKSISSLSWCIPKFSYLFLSASLDGSIKIWDLYRTNSVQCIKANSGLSAAKWSLDGGQIIAGGFEKLVYAYDVQTGKRIVEYNIFNRVTSIECHPYLEDIFLVGTRNAILGFDMRVNTSYPVRAFFSQCEEVLDIAFLDENEFICSTNVASHDSADRTIMAWDFASGAILSNQIYLELFTCPSLKVHPSDSSFIAQSNGNYMASFSTKRPYKMKDKRYEGHKVAGHAIECDISPDGKYAVSGDVEGSLHFYNYSTTNSILVTPKQKVPTNRLRWNPVLSSTLISSTYDGQIQIWK